METIKVYEIALTLIPGIGDVLAKNLVAYFGNAERVFHAGRKKLERVPGVGPRAADSIVKTSPMDRARKELAFAQRNGVEVIFFTDEAYPQRLKACDDGPVLIYRKGTTVREGRRHLAVVGTRHMTDSGKMICERIIAGLAEHDVTIISGLAYGVDICAHKAALANRMDTIAVLGHSLDRIYPMFHSATASRIMAQGALVTEFPSGTDPDRENFPRRNRIIAGMSDAVLVIETLKKGGAVITADIASSYNRDVLAVPGKPDDLWSGGCNNLIKTNRAALVESAQDILYCLGWDEKHKQPASSQKLLLIDLDPEEKRVMDFLKISKESHIDQLSTALKTESSKIAAALLSLECKGAVKCLPGKRYCLV